MISSHPGFYFVSQYTLHQVLDVLRVYRVVHELIFELDFIIASLIFPTKHMQFMQIIQIPPGEDAHITQV